MSFIGIVCGLKSEAAAVNDVIRREKLDAAKFRIGVSGANAARAEAIARGFAADGAKAILSVGVSGGLQPNLQPGDLILSNQVVDGAGGWSHSVQTDVGLLRTAAPTSIEAVIFGADEIIDGPLNKADIYARTGAVAVDMESHGAARAAQQAGLPFLAIRAIADPAERALPAAALGAVAPDGSTRVFSTLLKCAKAPRDFPALMQLGSDSEKALKALRGGLGLLLGRLLFRLDL